MEPISILLLAAVLTKMVTTHREDMEYARHGQESPRYKLKMAQFKAAQQAGQSGGRPPVRPGASGYLQELWRDAWDDMTERRRQARQERRDEQARQRQESLREWSRRSLNTRPDGRPVDDMVDVAGVRPEPVTAPGPGLCPVCLITAVPAGQQCPTCAFWRESNEATDRKLAAQQRRNADYERQNGEPEWLTPDPDEFEDLGEPVSVVHDDQHPYCLEPCGPDCGREAWRCGKCGDGESGFTSRAKAEESARNHRCPDDRREESVPDGQFLRHLRREWCGDPNCDCACKQCLKVLDQPGRNLCDECLRTPDTQPLAPVIPLFPSIKSVEKEISMSEVNGLSTAIAYANDIANVHTNFATAGAEGYVGALERGGNSGEVIASAREAMEASGIAADKWAAHKAILEQQTTVKEAYQSQPDAADKDFLLNG